MFFFIQVCVHGGLSPQLNLISDLDTINRFQELPKQGLFCDLMWSDPAENFDKIDNTSSKKELNKSLNNSTTINNNRTTKMSSTNLRKPPIEEPLEKYFTVNLNRGCSFNYSFLAVEKFLKRNKLISLIRAHQVKINRLFTHINYNYIDIYML